MAQKLHDKHTMTKTDFNPQNSKLALIPKSNQSIVRPELNVTKKLNYIIVSC